MSTNIIKQLDKLLKTKSKLYNEFNEYPDNSTLIYILIELVNGNYEFTRNYFDIFIEQACFENGGSYSFLTSQLDEHKLIIRYMLLKFDVTQEQLLKLFAGRSRLKNNYCFDILFEKQYNFTIDDFEKLYEICYVINLNDNYNMIHNNVVFSACMYLLTNKGSDNFDKCINLLKQNDYPFNIEHFNIILHCLMNRNCRECQNIHVLLDALFFNYNSGDDHDDKIKVEIFQLISHKNFSIRFDIIHFIINKFGYDEISIDYIFDRIINHNAELIFTLNNKGFNITVDFLNKLLEKSDISYLTLQKSNNQEYQPILSKFDKYNLRDNIIKIPILDLFQIYNLLPDVNTLNIACTKYTNESVIDILLFTYKIIPEKETLDMSILTLNCDLINKIINYKLTPDSKTLYNITKEHCYNRPYDVNKIIELLINHGLNITFNEVEYLLSIQFTLNNLERFDINYDDKLYFVCYLNNNYPVEYIKNFTIDKKILNMHELCKSKKLTYDKLINYLKTNNITLDRYALDNLLYHYPAISKHIIKNHKCVPSLLSAYKRTYTTCGLNISLKFLADEYNITGNDMLTQYDMDLNK
jgi:hypothetical protein